MCEIEGNHLSAAAIIGHDGTIWAQSATFPQVKPEEITAIMNDFNEPGLLHQLVYTLVGSSIWLFKEKPGL
ncbi:hypothetical protein R6Q59_013322 [Mikania micrantha]